MADLQCWPASVVVRKVPLDPLAQTIAAEHTCKPRKLAVVLEIWTFQCKARTANGSRGTLVILFRQQFNPPLAGEHAGSDVRYVEEDAFPILRIDFVYLLFSRRCCERAFS